MQLESIGHYLKDIQQGGAVAVITDSNVAPLYLDRCSEALRGAGYEVHEKILPAGEETKNGKTWLALLEYLSEIPLTRSDGVVALGGGMIGDLAGFAAASYLRGINVYQVPTTLLAAVDSSVGGKTAIDLPAGKNLAGAFHQPRLVLQDSTLLRTLPEAVFREGMAEVIKYGMIEDADFFRKLEDPSFAEMNSEEMIARCVSIKQRYVEEDEFDRGVRHFLNFGHTIGHAVEQLSEYTIPHGYAVAKGMQRVTEIAEREGWCEAGTAVRLRKMLLSYGFDLAIPYDQDAIYEVLSHDKKRTGSSIKLITPDRIGSCRIRTLRMEEVRALL